jgi:hypothetical protein
MDYRYQLRSPQVVAMKLHQSIAADAVVILQWANLKKNPSDRPTASRAHVRRLQIFLKQI